MAAITTTANALKSATTIVNVSAATAPSANQVLTATGGTAATWQTPTSGATDGWTDGSAYTWVYASASTFTIAGVDLTTTFTKGTRLKFTQTTVKYAVVVASSFSTNTTVTIAVNTDYTIANAAISLNYYSYQASPQGYPTWFTFNPTITFTGGSAPTGSPVLFQQFAILGNILSINLSNYSYTAGSGNTGANFASPVTAAGVQAIYGNIRNGDTPNLAFGYCLSGTIYVFCSSVASTGIMVMANIKI